MPDSVRHADALQRFHDTFFALRRRHSLPVGQRQFHVLVNREIANQIETLKYETNLAVANAGAGCKIQVFDRLVVQPVLPAGRRIEQAHNRKERGLAAS